MRFMQVKDMCSSIVNHITQRITSPLFGAFTISWLALNHRYLLIVFSKEEISTKLTLARDTC